MVDSKQVYNHYETLKVNANATQAEIKQSYRRLVKLFPTAWLLDQTTHRSCISQAVQS